MTGWLRAATQENSWLHRREVQFLARSIRQKARAVVGYTVDRLQNVFRPSSAIPSTFGSLA